MDPLTIGAIATGAVNLGTALFGKSQEAKKQRAYNNWLDKQQSQLDTWYNKEKNTKYLDTAEGSHMYNGMRRLLKERSNMVDNSLVKTGGSAEAKIAANAQAHETLANAAGNMSAKDTQRKQDLNTQYISQNNYLKQLRAGNMQSAIAGSANTGNNAMGALSGSITSIFESLSKK